MSKDKKGFFAEFKEFIMRGNVIDMAVGVIIASAFGKITTSLVNDVFMPALGAIIGDMDLTKLNWTIVEEVTDKATGEITTPAVTIAFGNMLSTIIDFVLIAFIIFLMIKVFAKTREITEKKLLRKKEEEIAEATEEAPPAPTQEELLTEILAELKKQNAKEE